MHIVVIGGGVYGLGAAYWTATLAPSESVTVLEREKVGHPHGRWVSIHDAANMPQPNNGRSVAQLKGMWKATTERWHAALSETPGYSDACTARATMQVTCSLFPSPAGHTE